MAHAHADHSTAGAHGDLSDHAGDPHTGAHGDHPSVMVYLVIFATLMALLGAAIYVGYAMHGTAGTVVGFAIGIAKAVLIVLYFMHVRYGTRLTWVFSVAAFLWLGIMLVMTMNDYITRGTPATRADPISQSHTPIVTTDSARGPIDRP